MRIIKQTKFSIIAMLGVMLLFFSGCSNKYVGLKNNLNKPVSTVNGKPLDMAIVKYTPIYVLFDVNKDDITINKHQTTPFSSYELNHLVDYNKQNKDTENKKDCIILNLGMEFSKCSKMKDENSFFMEKGEGFWNAITPKEFNNELFIKTGKYIHSLLHKEANKAENNYKNATSTDEKKKYEEMLYSFLDMSKLFNVTVLSKQGKKESTIDELSVLNNLLTNMQSNGALKLKVKISLNNEKQLKNIPIKYGTHSFDVNFNFKLTYRISAFGFSMNKDQTISRVRTVNLSPENNYTTVVDVDFGEFIQSSQGKFILTNTGQQLIGTKLDVVYH